MFTKELRVELALRIEKIQKNMKSIGYDAILVAGNPNLIYTSGRIFRGYVYIPMEGESYYFVVRPLGLNGNNVVYIRKPEQIPDELSKLGVKMPQNIGLEFSELTYSDVERLKNVFAGIEIKDSTMLLKRTRMVKTDYEISKMKEDGIHQTNAYAQVKNVYKKGMTDVDFQIAMEQVLRKEGSLGYCRTSGSLMEINMGSVLNGENADYPTPYDFAVGGSGVNTSLPVGANGKVMMPATTIMVDMNGNFNGYQTDITRVWKIGEISEFAEKAHATSQKILRLIEKIAMPGERVAALYEKAMEIVETEGLKDYFMGYSQQAAFIGHGVGLELNELPVLTPRSKDILEAGMTIAVEPKFVIPGVGAVGVENTYVVTANGLENITPFPEEIEELKG